MLAIVVQAVIRLAGKALKGPAPRVIALAAFLALFLLDAPFPVVIALALTGAVALHAPVPDITPDALPARDARGARHAAVWALFLWLAPVAALLLLAPGSVFADIAVFFSQLAVLTFGGAYAVLAWVAQEAAGPFGWLRPGEMLDGLGVAKNDAGPPDHGAAVRGLHGGAAREAGWEQPLLAATLGGLLATWVTCAPCFA